MDIDGDGEISDSDYAHFAYWIDIYENYGS
jgi:hypothetical protein